MYLCRSCWCRAISAGRLTLTERCNSLCGVFLFSTLKVPRLRVRCRSCWVGEWAGPASRGDSAETLGSFDSLDLPQHPVVRCRMYAGIRRHSPLIFQSCPNFSIPSDAHCSGVWGERWMKSSSEWGKRRVEFAFQERKCEFSFFCRAARPPLRKRCALAKPREGRS